MNRFEKYCWNKGIKNSFYGNRYLLNNQLFYIWSKLPQLIKKIFRIKKEYINYRIMHFMGIYK